jgi:release factor glutamine methyltransferase
MTSFQESIRKAAQQLGAVAENPEREGRLLLAHILKISYEEVYFSPDRQLTFEEERALEALLDRRTSHEPLSRILGHREFWSLPFRVTSDTLDPRPDSETLIESVLTFYPDQNAPLTIIDLGTGSGCLLLSLLHEYPNAWGVGIDAREAAIRIAQENAVSLNLRNRSAFLVGNWGDALSSQFDVIVSNPPYIAATESLPPEVALYDPASALYGGIDGLDCYRALATQLPNLAEPDSKIFLEIGAGQYDAVTSIFRDSPHPQAILTLTAVKDLQGHERCVILTKKTEGAAEKRLRNLKND